MDWSLHSIDVNLQAIYVDNQGRQPLKCVLLIKIAVILNKTAATIMHNVIQLHSAVVIQDPSETLARVPITYSHLQSFKVSAHFY